MDDDLEDLQQKHRPFKAVTAMSDHSNKNNALNKNHIKSIC
jgi:hypothetical protein